MAKSRKNYLNKKPIWLWAIIYLIVGGIIYAFLYFSGLVRIGGSNEDLSNGSSEIQYFE